MYTVDTDLSSDVRRFRQQFRVRILAGKVTRVIGYAGQEGRVQAEQTTAIVDALQERVGGLGAVDRDGIPLESLIRFCIPLH